MNSVENRNKHRPTPPVPDPDLPPAGPHAKPELADPIKTPGSGVVPEDRQQDIDTDAATG